MSPYISTPRLIVRTLYHFALFPYIVGFLGAPFVVYLLMKANVDIHGNLLKLLSEMGIDTNMEIYAFSVFAFLAVFFPLFAMIFIYRKYGRYGQLTFVLLIYLLFPTAAYFLHKLV